MSIPLNKPIVELSMIQTNHAQTKISEMKYFKILIQEFFVKVDQRILTSLIAFFTSLETTKSKQDSNELNGELAEVQCTLKDLIFANDEKNHKDLIYFHMCHISPIKIHLSYSMMDYGSSGDKLFLQNPYLQTIVSTLTDMQDVEFKLDYFEVTNCAHSLGVLTELTWSHYTHEVIRQGYKLMLGLDVIGNPYGLYRGISEGVESFFYEPYAGIIKGPTEFFEGVGVGIISLLGQTVGSTAGAFSKITGTIGKGLATLSFDKDYQKMRNKQSDAQSGSMKSIGQNLFKGVLGGITGIVTKPIDGAKQEGVEGLFKGVGKGLLGIVTKPVGSIVDFTSQSFEGIRKFVYDLYLRFDTISRIRAFGQDLHPIFP
jgi:vacuolar protein sorting-associated protein 13A/C